MIEDRTKAHADHVGHGHERITTAAVGKIYCLYNNIQHNFPLISAFLIFLNVSYLLAPQVFLKLCIVDNPITKIASPRMWSPLPLRTLIRWWKCCNWISMSRRYHSVCSGLRMPNLISYAVMAFDMLASNCATMISIFCRATLFTSFAP